jgi:hypothetical protein
MRVPVTTICWSLSAVASAALAVASGAASARGWSAAGFAGSAAGGWASRGDAAPAVKAMKAAERNALEASIFSLVMDIPQNTLGAVRSWTPPELADFPRIRKLRPS